MFFRKVAMAVAVAGLVLGFAPQSQAASVDIVATEVGSDVVFSATGTFSVAGLTKVSTVGAASVISGTDGLIQFGGSGDLYSYDAPTAFNFSSGGFDVANSNTGGIFGFDPRNGIKYLMVPFNFTSGAINSTMTFAGQTFASLGLINGYSDQIQFSNGQTVSLNIGVSAVPLPAALPMLLAALGGLGLVARRRKLA